MSVAESRFEHRLDGGTDLASAAALLAKGERVIAQFGAATYNSRTLAEVDRLAKQFGRLLKVRFFGHYGSQFDFTVLRRVPHISNLTVDCDEAINFEVLQDLEFLQAVHVGVFIGVPDDLLSYRSLHRVESLGVGGGSSNRLMLDCLGAYTRLADLTVAGYTKGIEELAGAKKLMRLRLTGIGSKQRLHFVNKLPALRELSLLLGGRQDIDEVVCPTVQRLELIRVRGLARVRTENFVGLEHFEVQDQLQLRGLTFSGASRRLLSCRVVNCKTLHVIEGLKALEILEGLHVYLTAVDFDELVRQGLPSSLKVLAFHDRSRRADAVIQKKLADLGFTAPQVA